MLVTDTLDLSHPSVGVTDGLAVAVLVAVAVGVLVAVAVDVLVAVDVEVAVAVEVSVAVTVKVAVTAGVLDGNGVFVGAAQVEFARGRLCPGWPGRWSTSRATFEAGYEKVIVRVSPAPNWIVPDWTTTPPTLKRHVVVPLMAEPVLEILNSTCPELRHLLVTETLDLSHPDADVGVAEGTAVAVAVGTGVLVAAAVL